MNGFLQGPWLPRVGWTLLHALWEGMLVALAAALVLRGLSGFSPRLRYAVAVTALLVMAGLPLRHLAAFQRAPSPTFPIQAPLDRIGSTEAVTLPVSGNAPWSQAAAHLEPAMPWIVAAWAAGVLLGVLRLAGGWACLQRLRCRKAALAPTELQGLLLDLCRRAGLQRAVTLLLCDGLTGPCVTGVIRQAILVPAG